MSLRDTESVDVVAKGIDGGHDLFMIDSGDIPDEQERHHLLTQKLISYAEYVASGQYRTQAPEASPESFTVRVICQTPPNDSMRQITSIATRQDPVVRLPVVFELDSDFRARISQRATSTASPQTQKPWWRLW
jgi:hypothetical protein